MDKGKPSVDLATFLCLAFATPFVSHTLCLVNGARSPTAEHSFASACMHFTCMHVWVYPMRTTFLGVSICYSFCYFCMASSR
jgi:hypothetical protein